MSCRLLSVLFAAVVAGCAGGGQASPEDGAGRVTVVVANEYANAVTAYAVWPGGRRNRLGDIQPARTRTFDVPRAGDQISIGLELMAAPPVGTTAGPTGFQGGSLPRINPEMVMSESVMLRPGEGIEWRILSTGSLVYNVMLPE